MYNGWKNYETWNVALWIGNDEPLYRLACSYVRGLDEVTAADAEKFVKGVLPNGTKDFKGRGGSACYAEVDWDAIAEALAEYK